MANIHTVEVVCDADHTNYRFLKNGKDVTFEYLRPSLDIRGGVEKRSTDYLVDQGIYREDDEGRKIVEVTGLWEAFYPKTPGTYELLQGNTRLKFLQECFDRNRELYLAAQANNDFAAFDQERYYFRPINFVILPKDVDPDNAEQHEYIIWRQSSTNNAVRPHSALSLALLGLEYLEAEFAKDEQLPKDQKEGKEKIRERVARIFKVHRQRTTHWERVRIAQEHPAILEALESGTLSLDVFIRMYGTVNKLVDQFVKAHTELTKQDAVILAESRGAELGAFYRRCLDKAIAVAAEKNGRVILGEKVVDSSRKELESIMFPTVADEELESSENGSSNGSEEGSNNDSGEGSEEGSNDRYNVSVELLVEMIGSSLEWFLEYGVVNNDGDPVFDDKDLAIIAKTLESTQNKLSKLMTIDQKAAKALELEAEKHRKAEAKKAEADRAKAEAKIKAMDENWTGPDEGKSHSEAEAVTA